jgi:hypothetical protein
MGDYYEEDPNAAWNAGFEADPATTAYALAQAAIAEHETQNQQGLDEERVAEQAASILAQQQAQQAVAQANEQVARTVDRSMVAAYGAKYAQLAPQIGQRLAGDPAFSQINTQDANAVLQYIDKTFNEISRETDPNVAEWQAIQKAGPRKYFDSRAVIDNTLGS